MQDVEVEVLDSGLWICHSKECRFRYECANHTTAGDFRTEGGFTPKLFERTVGVWSCETIDAESEYNEPKWFRNHTPKGEYGLGALLADGRTCDPFREEQTFEDCMREAREALDKAWRKVPTRRCTPYQPWQIQGKIASCRDAITTIADLVKPV